MLKKYDIRDGNTEYLKIIQHSIDYFSFKTYIQHLIKKKKQLSSLHLSSSAIAGLFHQDESTSDFRKEGGKS